MVMANGVLFDVIDISLSLLSDLVLMIKKASNGWRYLRVGGRGFYLGAGKTRSQKNA
jgi:hypothetical protein